MKEIQAKYKDKVVKVQQKQQEYKQKLVGRIKPHPGHTLYEINPKQSSINEAIFEKVNAAYNGSVHKKVIVKDDCFYISALNKRNAIKKAKRLFPNLKL